MRDGHIEESVGKPDRVEDFAGGTRWYWEKISPRGWIEFGAESREARPRPSSDRLLRVVRSRSQPAANGQKQSFADPLFDHPVGAQ